MSDLFNVSTNPHVRSKDTTQTIMRDVLIALTPASIFGIYNFGLGALLRIVIGIAVCVAAEGAYQYFMHKKVTISDLSAAVFTSSSGESRSAIKTLLESSPTADAHASAKCTFVSASAFR